MIWVEELEERSLKSEVGSRKNEARRTKNEERNEEVSTSSEATITPKYRGLSFPEARRV
jgi:hypothetical protein